MVKKTRAGKQGTAIRQEQIAQAALGLAASRGLKGLSVAAVAREVGLVPSAIYRHYRGKGEVLDAVLELIRDRLRANVAAVQAETADPLERIRRLLLRHVQLLLEYQAIPRILFSEEVYSGHPDRKARLYGVIQEYLGRIAELVREGQLQKRIRPEARPETVAVMFIGLFAPTMMLWHLSDGGFDVHRHLERAWGLFAASLTPKQVKRKRGGRKIKNVRSHGRPK